MLQNKELDQARCYDIIQTTKQDTKFRNMRKYAVSLVDKMVSASETRGRSRLQRPREHGKAKAARLPVLVWHPSSKDMNRLIHTLNGNTMASETGARLIFMCSAK